MRRGFLIVLASSLLLVSFFLIYHRVKDDSPSARIHQLAETSGEARHFEGRLARSGRHKPFKSPTRGAAGDVHSLDAAVRLERLGAAESDEGHRTAASGLAMLYRGDVDSAIELLAEAAVLRQDGSDYLVDLSAASLARGSATDLLQALDASERALELSPGDEAAGFNRALALQSLGLFEAAAEAWSELLQMSTGSEWNQEIRERSTTIPAPAAEPTANAIQAASPAQQRQLVELWLDRVRQQFELELLPGAARSCARPAGAECGPRARQLSTLARAAASFSPDGWWQALVAQLEQWPVTGVDEHDVSALAEYARAMKLFNNERPAEAAPVFATLEARRDPQLFTVHWNSAYQRCVDAYFRSQHAAARDCLTGLERQIAPKRFLFLHGRIEWIRAQVSLVEGDLARAADDYRRAAETLRASRDHNQVAALESLQATLLEQLGALEDGWDARIRALTGARLDARRRHTLFTAGGRSAALQGYLRTALHLTNAAVANAERWRQPGALVEAHINRANILQRIGRADAARADVQTARRHFSTITDARARSRFEAELTVMEGELLAGAGSANALAKLADASRQLTDLRFELLRPRVERAIGIAAERAGHIPEAQAAFERGVRAAERQRSPLGSSARMQSVDLVWEMYERLITHRLNHGGPEAAFSVVEASRAKVLQESIPDPSPDIASAQVVVDRLETGATLVYFAVLEDEIVRWTIRSTGAVAARFPVSRARLDHLVRRFRRTLTTDAWESDWRAASAPLLDLVVPQGERGRSDAPLIIVPDGPLHELPFVALREASTGRHLIENRPVAIVPSLKVLMNASRAADERFGTLETALVVEGRMGMTKGEFLPMLPSAKQEVRQIAARYRRSRILAGERATPQAFLREVGSFQVVHFAGHGIADRMTPEASRLFLTGSPETPSGWLLLGDLQELALGRTALVVLGACETGAGRILRGEGAVTFARPFLAKGAAGVVYSLWQVPDALSSRLLLAFHDGVLDGQEPAIALQRAQIRLLKEVNTGDARRTWSAFQYAGGIRGLVHNN